MDDMGQRGGGVFFTLTFSQAADSLKEPVHVGVGTSLSFTMRFFLFSPWFDLFTSKCQQEVKLQGL